MRSKLTERHWTWSWLSSFLDVLHEVKQLATARITVAQHASNHNVTVLVNLYQSINVEGFGANTSRSANWLCAEQFSDQHRHMQIHTELRANAT